MRVGKNIVARHEVSFSAHDSSGPIVANTASCNHPVLGLRAGDDAESLVVSDLDAAEIERASQGDEAVLAPFAPVGSSVEDCPAIADDECVCRAFFNLDLRFIRAGGPHARDAHVGRVPNPQAICRGVKGRLRKKDFSITWSVTGSGGDAEL